MARGIHDREKESCAMFVNESHVSAVMFSTARPPVERDIRNARDCFRDHDFHTLNATVVPTPTSEVIRKSSTNRLTPGRPKPSVPEEL